MGKRNTYEKEWVCSPYSLEFAGLLPSPSPDEMRVSRQSQHRYSDEVLRLWQLPLQLLRVLPLLLLLLLLRVVLQEVEERARASSLHLSLFRCHATQLLPPLLTHIHHLLLAMQQQQQEQQQKKTRDELLTKAPTFFRYCFWSLLAILKINFAFTQGPSHPRPPLPSLACVLLMQRLQ